MTVILSGASTLWKRAESGLEDADDVPSGGLMMRLKVATALSADEVGAVVPFHARAHFECVDLAVAADLPTLGQVGDDRLEAVGRVEPHQVAVGVPRTAAGPPP